MSFLLSNTAGICLSAGVVLNILKTAGIVVLVVVIVIAIAAACVMFVPVRYQAKGDTDTMSFEAKFHWLLRIIMFRFIYRDNKTDYALYLFGIRTRILDKDAMEARKKRREKRKRRRAKRKANKAARSRKKRKAKYQKEHDKYKEQFLKENPELDKSQFEDETLGSVPDNKEKVKTAAIESEETTEQSSKKKPLEIIKKVVHIIQVVQQYQPVRMLWADIQQFLYRARPRQIKGDIRFGFSDPSITGKILGGISNLYFIYLYDDLHICPDFETEEDYFEGNIDLKGHMRAVFAAVLAFRIFKKKQFRKFLKALKL